MARLLAVLAGAAIAVAMLAVGVALSAGGAASVTLKRADSIALKALHVKRGNAPVAVFRSRRPLRPGAVIAQAGTPPRPGAARRVGDNVLRRAGVEFSQAPVVMRVGREPAYLYFEDLAPYQAWEHPARIVLVGARTGRVRRSRTIWWPPVVSGRLPSYLRSAAAYAGGSERIFYRGWPLPAATAARAARPAHAAAADSAAMLAAAHELGDQHACAVRVTDVLGSFFTFASINQTRAAMGTLFRNLSRLDARFQTFRYVSGSGQTPSGFVSRIVDRHGCRDVLIYVTGSGMRDAHEPTVSLGRRVRHDGSVLQSPLTVGDLVHAIRQHEGVEFSVKIDAPYSGGFVNPLAGEANVPLVETATGSGASFAALPEDAANAGRFLEFSNRELAGIERFLSDQAEVQHGIDEVHAGHAPSFLAWMLARGLAISPVPDLAAALGVHFQLKSKFAPSGPGGGSQNHAPNAHDVAVTTTAGQAVGVTLAGNDPDGDPLTFTVVTNPSHGTLTGTPPNLTYTPAPAFTGHDSFTFTASDGHLTSNTATAHINVARVAPTVTTTSGATTWTEDGGPVAVDDGLTVADLSSATLTTATARISAGAVTSQDELAFTAQHGITGSYDAASSTLTLTGAASVADYQDALRSVTYDNSSQDPQGTSRTIELRVGDSDGLGPAATKALTIVPVDDAPVVTTTSAALAYTENDPATPVDGGLDVTDVDSANLAGATVSITSNYASGEDVLGFTDQNGITGAFNATTGVLTLTGAATVADYRTALRSVTYRNTSDDPSTATRTVSFTATDGSLTSATASRDITVAAVNDAPVVTTSSGSAAYTEGGTAAVVDPSVTVSDADDASLAGASVAIGSPVTGDSLAADTSGTSISASFAGGTLTLSGSDTVAHYQQVLRTVAFSSSSADPTAGGTATSRTITFTATDGTDTSGPATRDVDITAVDQAPVVTTSVGTASWTEGDPGTPIDPAVQVADADNANLAGATVAITTGFLAGDELQFTDQNGIHGSYDASTGVLTLTGTAPLSDYQTALRSVAFSSSSDDPTALDSDTVRTVSFVADDGTQASTPATRDVAVVGVNDAPVVTTSSGSAAYTEGGTAAIVDPGVTVSDADNANLTAASVFIGTPVAGDALAADTSGTSISASYDSGTGVLTLSGADTVANYQQVLRTVAFSSTSQDPTAGGTAPSRTITFTATDGTDPSGPATRDVDITAVNQAPVVTASSGSASWTEGDPGTPVDPSISVTDADSANLTGGTVYVGSGLLAGDRLGFTDQNGIHGSYDAASGVLTLTGTASVSDYQAALQSVTFDSTSDDPTAEGTDGARSIGFKVTDGTDESAPDFRGVDVTGVNDPPVLTTSSGSAAYTEGGTAAPVDPSVSVTDADNANLAAASVSIGSPVAGDTLAADTSGTSISASYDGSSGVLTLNGSDTVAHYQQVLRTVAFSSTSDDPTVGDTRTSRTITFVADDGIDLSAPATRGVNVTAVDSAPVVTPSGGSTSFVEGTPAAVDSGVTVTDPDNSNLAGATVSITGNFASGEDVLHFSDQNGITGSYNASTGVLALSGSASVADYQTALRSITYEDTSDNPSTAVRTVTFVVDDGILTSAPATKTVTVTPVDDAPVVTTTGGTDSYTEQDPAIVVDAGVTVTDVDSATLTGATVTIAAGFDTGDALALPPTGSGISGTWDPVTHTLGLSGLASVGAYQDALQSVTFVSTSDNPSTSKTISFVADDGVLTSAAATKGIAVTPVNDAPHLTSSGGDINALERTPTVLDSTIGVSDPDDTNLQGATVAISSGLQSGEDTLNFTNQNGITGSYNASTGVLSLTGSASLANYQTALRSVTYTDTSHTPNTTTRQVGLVVDDGHAANNLSNTIVHNLTVTPVNEAPTAGSDSYSGAIGNTTFGVGTSPSGPAVTTSGNVLGNDTDPDTPHASLTASAGTTSSHGGTVSMNSDGTFTYVPPAGFTGSDTFTYTVHDNDAGGDLTGTGTVTISVVGPVVWYVNNAAGGGGDGRSGSPFTSLAPLTTGGAADSLDGSGDIIFLYQGSGSYGGGIVLEANQQLIGQPQGLTVNGHGLVAAGGSNPTVTNASGAGITLASGVDVERVNVSSTSGDGITGTSVSTATVGSNTSVSNAGGAALKLSGGNGNVTVGANLSSSAARAVDIQNRSGGTTTLNGTVGTGGVFLNGNASTTVALTGTLTLSTAANDAFTATAGGTVTATGSGSTIATTTGRAINVANTTIGTGGINFKSASTNGAASPINLDTTGSTAGLTITGDGNTTRGGNSSGGTIQSGSGSDGTTGGIGIRLNSTSQVSLNDMHVSGFSNFGVSGSSVAGLTLDHSTVDGTNGSNDALDEGSISLANLTGSASLSGDVISGGWTNNVLVHNTAGTLNRLTVDNSTIGLNSTSFGNDGLQFTADGASTTANITVSNSSFTGARGDWLTINPLNAGHTDAVISGNTFTNTHPNTSSGGARIALIPNGTLTYDVNGNTLSGSLGSAIFDNAANSLANADGKIRNNTIGVAGTANSGSSQASGIDVESNGGGDQVVLVDSNAVRQYNDRAILLQAGDSQGSTTVFQATVTNNTVSNPGTNSTDFNGIHLNNGIVTGDNFTSCVDIRGNAITGSGTGPDSPNNLDFRLRQRITTTVRLPGYVGANNNDAGVVAFLQGQNHPVSTPSGAVSETVATGGGGFVGGAACTQP